MAKGKNRLATPLGLRKQEKKPASKKVPQEILDIIKGLNDPECLRREYNVVAMVADTLSKVLDAIQEYPSVADMFTAEHHSFLSRQCGLATEYYNSLAMRICMLEYHKKEK